MRSWDLTSGGTKLEEALKALNNAWSETGEYWDDGARRDFEQQYLGQLEPRARRALRAIKRAAEVFAKAERECSEESYG